MTYCVCVSLSLQSVCNDSVLSVCLSVCLSELSCWQLQAYSRPIGASCQPRGHPLHKTAFACDRRLHHGSEFLFAAPSHYAHQKRRKGGAIRVRHVHLIPMGMNRCSSLWGFFWFFSVVFCCFRHVLEGPVREWMPLWTTWRYWRKLDKWHNWTSRWCCR